MECGSRVAIIVGHHPTRPSTVACQLRRLLDGRPGPALAAGCCMVERHGSAQSRLLLSLPAVAAEEVQLDLLVAAPIEETLFFQVGARGRGRG